ncbi:hypothetical protein JTE90_013851, partial [Oedothorax gibbosus]
MPAFVWILHNGFFNVAVDPPNNKEEPMHRPPRFGK